MIRVAILWDGFPNYISKCVETLAKHENMQVLAHGQGEGAFPNVLEPLRRYPNIRLFENSTPEEVFKECMDFEPHLAVVTVHRRGLYANIASAWRKSDTLVIGASDHMWKGDWRDYVNLLASKLGWFSQFEAILVPGALGKIYAKKLGFPDKAIFDGLYTCDTDIFRPIGLNRHADSADTDWPRVFLFAGQYIRRKGFDILLKAYQAYRQQAKNPWELWLIGRGDMEGDIGGATGVRNLGEKSSSQITEIMLQAGCFVLPSWVDHWPLVIHEAASAGLPILASSMCGASVELLQSGYNGYVFPVNNINMLARLLLFMDEGGLARVMGKNSLSISTRFSLELWTKKICRDIPLFMRGKTLI